MPYFFKTAEIKGASRNPAFQQEIELLSFQKVSDPANGLPTGKRMHKPFVITKEIDETSPSLMNNLANNKNVEKREILEFYKKR
jgi:type VI secretion system secreted protein Hcp